MTSVVLLCRHGNTFQRGEKVVMVGSRHDLPLTDDGLAQADAVAAALTRQGMKLQYIAAGPLQRTRVFAERIRDALAPNAACVLDTRLTELDYGAWNGLSDEEISARFGAEALHGWRERGERPTSTTFEPSEQTVQAESRDLLTELATVTGVSLVVTSNGRLREIGKMIGRTEQSSYAVSTGSLCVILHQDGMGWRVVGWNLKPAQLDTVDLKATFHFERSSPRS